jgi:hypothetical protein
MPLTEVNHQAQPDHPSRMPLAEANHQSQPGHPSRMLLVEVNRETQPDHPFWMSLAEANHLFINNYSFDNLVFVLTQYGDIHDKTFHKLTL